jgi:hypothetical protein
MNTRKTSTGERSPAGVARFFLMSPFSYFTCTSKKIFVEFAPFEAQYK